MSPRFSPVWASIDYVNVVRSGSGIELSVLGLLALVSIVSWALIAQKSFQLGRARSQSLSFLDAFWKGTRLEGIYQSAQKMTGSPLSRVFCAGYEELSRIAQASQGAN